MDEQKNIMSEFAIASLAIAAISFINFAGMEKAILAIILGTIALKKMKKEVALSGVNFARAGIILAFLSLYISINLMIKFYPKVKEMMSQMQSEQSPMKENVNLKDRQQPERIPGARLF
ncbi:MAG: hypothetical protein KJ710_05715 [Candidatus Omnitrophica bacterium]|nr:hypothetical protein [Candidatus Omnitrophota bacterium]MBU1923732.1 hypothetical protein [Candidatus Omnitrophota bacterium]